MGAQRSTLNAIFCAIFILLIPLSSFSQESFDCGESSAPASLYRAFLKDIDSDLELSLQFPFQVPVTFHVFYESSLDISWLENASKAKAIEALEYLNERVTPGMQFYLADYYQYADTGYGDEVISTPTQDPDFFPGSDFRYGAYLDYENLGTMNVYTSGAAAAAFGDSPWSTLPAHGIWMPRGYQKALFAHEVGHYFGLVHTFEGAVTGEILPQNQWNSDLFDIGSCDCCDCSTYEEGGISCNGLGCPVTVCDCNAFNSGDFIADTPPDPRNCASGNCGTEDCVKIFGGIEYVYNPDRANIMSYYSACRDHFSLLQQDRIFTTLLNYPTRSHLMNVDPTLYLTGEVLYPRYQEGENFTFDPLLGAQIHISSEAGLDYCDKTTNELGLYDLLDCYPYLPTEFVAAAAPGEERHFRPQEGVTTLDIILMNKHILNIQLLPAPYGLIAGDVNNSGAVTTFDIIKVRQLILGLIDELPSGTWHFVPTYPMVLPVSFADDFPSNPFGAIWDIHNENRSYNGIITYFDKTNVITTNNVRFGMKEAWSFHAVKKGDVNFSLFISDEVNLKPEEGDYEFKTTNANQVQNTGGFADAEYVLTAKLNPPTNVLAYQFELKWDPTLIEVSAVESGNTFFSLDYFNLEHLSEGQLKTSWISSSGNPIAANEVTNLFKLRVKTSEGVLNMEDMINVSSEGAIMPPVFYRPDGEIIEHLNLKWRIKESDQKYKVKNAYPNPITNEINFVVELKEAAQVDVAIYDRQGNVKNTNFGQFQAGEHLLQIPNSTELNIGLLNYQISIGAEILTGNLIKL